MKNAHSSPVQFSRRRGFTRDLAISFLMQQGIENPNCLSLAAGLVDPQTLPIEATRAAAQEVLSNATQGRAALQYGTTPGSLALRKQLLIHFQSLESANTTSPADKLTPDRLVATTGSQQLLSLVCEVLLDEGDICLVARPTYFVFLGNLAGVGAEIVTVPADNEGMQPDALDAALQQIAEQGNLHRVKLIYVVSEFDNPSGISVSTSRRARIVEIARKWSQTQRIFVLEDAAYRELNYDDVQRPSLWSADHTGEHVIYTQTFSKTFSPGVRVGFGVLPADLVEPICDRKGNEDFGSPNLNQHLMTQVLHSGTYRQHLEQVKNGYAKKRDTMLTALEQNLSGLDGVSWIRPCGGLYVWLSLRPEIQTGFKSRLFQTAVEQGVMYVPGELFYAGPIDDRPRHQMRLSYGVLDNEQLTEAIRRLAVAIKIVMS